MKPLHPAWRRAAYQQGLLKIAGNVAQPIKAVIERTVVEEHLRSHTSGAVAAKSPQPTIEKVAIHGRACALPIRKQQEAMAFVAFRLVRAIGRQFIDFALPPRCAGCGEVIGEAGAFCAACWSELEWLGSGGCQTCGIPLVSTELGTCGRCLAKPPKIDRIRAAVAYDDISRSIALRLKYGRKVALARTMARYIAPLGESWSQEAILVPVPLHRRRLWFRGFNQSALVARELAKAWQLPVATSLIKRIKATRPLKGLNHSQRRAAVARAFTATDRQAVDGRTIILIDDVLTSGSTAEACASALRKAGAGRVELFCWARVVRPAQLMR